MKAILSFLLLCASVSPQISLLTETPSSQPSEVSKRADHLSRVTYWYYLRKANILYSSEFQSDDRTLVFTIYRNYVGTFLSICSVHSQPQSTDIQTFVRLGNGYLSGASDSDMSPLQLRPLFIQYRVAAKQYVVELSDSGSFEVKGLTLEPNVNSNEKTNGSMDAKRVDAFLRSNYWFYLDGAKLLQTQILKTNINIYCLFTYNHLSGSYVVISSMDSNNNIIVNTFARLGKGVEETNGFTIVIPEIEPSVLILS